MRNGTESAALSQYELEQFAQFRAIRPSAGFSFESPGVIGRIYGIYFIQSAYGDLGIDAAGKPGRFYCFRMVRTRGGLLRQH